MARKAVMPTMLFSNSKLRAEQNCREPTKRRLMFFHERMPKNQRLMVAFFAGSLIQISHSNVGTMPSRVFRSQDVRATTRCS